MTTSGRELVKIGDLLSLIRNPVTLEDDVQYTTITVKRRHGGLEPRDVKLGSEIQTKKQYALVPGAFIISRVQCWHSAFAVVPTSSPGNMIASQNYDQFVISERVHPRYFWWLSHSPKFLQTVRDSAFGVVIEKMVFNRDTWLEKTLPIVPYNEQQTIARRIDRLATKVAKAQELRRQSVELYEKLGDALLETTFSSVNAQTKPLREVVEKGTGQAYRAHDFAESGAVPVVRLAEIQTHCPTVFLTNPDDYNNVWVEPGDLVLAKTSFSTGEMCLWGGPRSVLNQNAVRIRAGDLVRQHYLYYWLKLQVRSYLARQLADPNFYPYIREKDLFAWEIPVPPISMQDGIVTKLDRATSHLRSMREAERKTSFELECLMPSILNAEFLLPETEFQ